MGQTTLAEPVRLGARRAVVIGAGMAGLVAARVLSAHFDEVALVERDRLNDEPEPRPGVPQANQPHVLLRRGEEVLSDLFPDLVSTLIAGGAVQVTFSLDVLWYYFDTYKLRFDAGISYLAMSRPFLEAAVRRRVLAMPNLRRLDDCAALGLAGRDGTVKQVMLRRGDGGEESLEADLVIDASGRGSRAPAWLRALGYEQPHESRVVVQVGYATRLFRRSDDPRRDWKVHYVLGSPPHGSRGGLVLPIEGDRWMVGLAGWLGDYPPSDPEGFLAFARGLPAGEISRLIEQEEPLDGISIYRYPSNLRRRYERLQRRPEGFVVMGDALCSFNPIYGQGMTVAALSAAALGDALCAQRRQHGRGELRGFSTRFQHAVARVIDVPWSLAIGEDLRFPGVKGRRSPGFSILGRYFRRVHRQSARDREVARCLFRVLNLLDPPSALLQPGIVLRVLRGAWGRGEEEARRAA